MEDSATRSGRGQGRRHSAIHSGKWETSWETKWESAYMTEKGRMRYQPLLLEIETQQLFAVGNNVSYSCIYT